MRPLWIFTWSQLFSPREHCLDMPWKMRTDLPVGAFEYFSFPFVWHISVYNMFLILLLSRYVGNRSPLSWNKMCTVLFCPAFELLICVSLCDLSFHEPTLPVWFPTNYYLATVAGYHIYGPQGLENMSEGDRLGDDDESSLSGRDWFVFPLLFFSQPCRPFSSHLCFLHMQAVVRSPE